MYEPSIIGFLCYWCSYRGADTAGMARLKYPPNVKIIRVPCSGRISPELVLRTFREGADGVMVLGCHIGDCHYSTGNHRTAKRMPIVKQLTRSSPGWRVCLPSNAVQAVFLLRICIHPNAPKNWNSWLCGQKNPYQ